MSTTETKPESAEVEAHDDSHDDVDHDDIDHDDIDHDMHPSDWKYIQIAIILALLTVAEVALYYFPPGPFEVPMLIALMIVKFVMVLMWFMHLKFDSPMFTKAFVAGLGLAVTVYVALLSVFEFWAS